MKFLSIPKTTLLLVAVFFVVLCNAQDTKLKKKVFSVDEVPIFVLENCAMPAADNTTCMAKSSITGEPIFTTYVVNGTGSPFIADIRFVDFNEELRTSGMFYKKIFSEMYNMGVFNDDGTINQENATKFARAYDIIKDRKVYIISE